MKPERMNAFTDGVVAILITILVLELRPPSASPLDILDEKGRLLPYVLSFVFVAIYWVNHHHLMQVVHRIDGRVLWANIHLLFWLSLTPIATAWLGEAGVEPGPVAAYAIVLLGCAIAYTILTLCLLGLHEPGHSSPRQSATTAKARSRSPPTSSRSPAPSSSPGSRSVLRRRRRRLGGTGPAGRARHRRQAVDSTARERRNPLRSAGFGVSSGEGEI